MSTNVETPDGVHLGKFWYQGTGKGSAWIWQIGPTGLADTVDGVRAKLTALDAVIAETGDQWDVARFLSLVDRCTRIDAEAGDFC